MALERLSSEDRKRQIAEEALRILASKGAHRLTAMEIAQAIGVSDAAVFRHYRNKEEIVAAAIARFEELLEGDDPEASAEEDPLSRLGAFFVRRLHKVRRYPEILRLAFNDRLAEVAGPSGAARVQQVIGRSIGFQHACLKQAQKEGLVAADVPTELLVWMVTGSLRGCATAARGRAPEAVWEELERLLRRTAQPRARAARASVRRKG